MQIGVPLQLEQSLVAKQWVRQTALTHSWLPAHSELFLHCGVLPPTAWQTPPVQVSPACGQSLGCEQARWQTPLMQLPPLEQSLL